MQQCPQRAGAPRPAADPQLSCSDGGLAHAAPLRDLVRIELPSC
jgi:hypothetical protein